MMLSLGFGYVIRSIIVTRTQSTLLTRVAGPGAFDFGLQGKSQCPRQRWMDWSRVDNESTPKP